MTSPPNTTTGRNVTANSNFTKDLAQGNYTRSSITTEMIDILGTVPIRDPVRERQEYFEQNYKPETGLRIATTLGSFFLLVLLTLLYKSKCKKHTPVSTPVPLCSLDGGAHSIPCSSDQFGHLNQVYPYRNHCPAPKQPPHPAVLLTSAHSSSESSDNEDTKPLYTAGSFYAEQTPLKQGRLSGTLQKQNIDIHVILPTPTISPSSSEHFKNEMNDAKFPSGKVRRSGSDVSTISVPVPGPFFFLQDNLKYVDDTSSENIPEDTRSASIGSDSVFIGYEPPPSPPLPPRRKSTLSGYSGLNNEEEGWGVTLQAQAQIHHRDSFCSDLESVNDYTEGQNQTGNRRRSSSTQTTLSDLQHCLNLQQNSPSSLRLGPRSYQHQIASLRQSPTIFLTPRVSPRKKSIDTLLVENEQHQHL